MHSSATNASVVVVGNRIGADNDDDDDEDEDGTDAEQRRLADIKISSQRDDDFAGITSPASSDSSPNDE